MNHLLFSIHSSSFRSHKYNSFAITGHNVYKYYPCILVYDSKKYKLFTRSFSIPISIQIKSSILTITNFRHKDFSWTSTEDNKRTRLQFLSSILLKFDRQLRRTTKLLILFAFIMHSRFLVCWNVNIFNSQQYGLLNEFHTTFDRFCSWNDTKIHTFQVTEFLDEWNSNKLTIAIFRFASTESLST